MTYYTKDALKEAIQQKLRLNYGCTEKQATDGEIMKACALAQIGRASCRERVYIGV